VGLLSLGTNAKMVFNTVGLRRLSPAFEAHLPRRLASLQEASLKRHSTGEAGAAAKKRSVSASSQHQAGVESEGKVTTSRLE
jgi:hypothetical protein